jgi:hypothetical protein
MITTRLVRMALMMSSFLAVMGRSGKKLSWAGLFPGVRTGCFRGFCGFFGDGDGRFCILGHIITGMQNVKYKPKR